MLRHPSSPSLAALVALSSALLGVAVEARAQDAGVAPAATSAGQIALAREEFRRGTDAAHANRWVDALEHFTRADALVDHARPEVLLDLAGAQVQTGHLVAGAESYRRFLRDVTDGPLAIHRSSAQQTLAAVEARTPHVNIAAVGLGPDDELTVDGAVVAHAVLGAPFPVDPGEHTIVVARAASEIAREVFRVAENQRHVVSLELPAPPVVDDAGAPSQAAPSVVDAGRVSAHGSDAELVHRVLRPPTRTPPRPLLASPWFWAVSASVLVLLGVGGAIWGWIATTPQPVTGTLGIQMIGGMQ